MQNVNQKNLLIEIEKVGGVSKENAQNIFGIMTRAIKNDIAGFVSALVPTTKKLVTARKTVKKTVKKVTANKTAKKVTTKKTTKKTAKKAIPAVAKKTVKRKSLKKPVATTINAPIA